MENQVEESALGQQVKCPKSRESITAERPGLYNVIEVPKPRGSSSAVPAVPAAQRNPSSRRRTTKASRVEPSEELSNEKKIDLLSIPEKRAEE